MSHRTAPAWVAGAPERSTPAGALTIHDKHTGEPIADAALADAGAVARAIAAAHACHQRRDLADLPSHARASALRHIADRLAARAEEFSSLLVAEVGKTIREARAETARAVETFRIAAEESARLTGEFLPLDNTSRLAGYDSVSRRAPVGVCSFISPFNFPLNLAAHKIGPAVAAGCPFVLKPSPRAPLAAILLGELLAETALPAGAWSIMLCDDAAADALVSDPRPRLLSFTGSPAVGWALKARAGKKHVVLELGGVGCCIVDDSADIPRAAARIVAGAFSTAGQSCISVQRVLALPRVLAPLRDELLRRTAALRVGDPRDEATDVGPLISEDEARRVESWIADAVASGARRLLGGARSGRCIQPAIIESPPADSWLTCREVFGPVMTLEPSARFEDALDAVNALPFGLQTGVFTNDLRHALLAWRSLDVGAVILNDIPTTRSDSAPYGGVKDSGLGREGVRSAIAHMTEPRMLVISPQ